MERFPRTSRIVASFRRIGERLTFIETPERKAEKARILADPLVAVVKRSLEDPRFTWRTIDGVAQQVGINPGFVDHAIDELARAEVVYESEYTDPDGNERFTTQQHLWSRTPLLTQLAHAMRLIDL